jgi:sigma-B regulation protein RsbU (phosphoserine phosphatase)
LEALVVASESLNRASGLDDILHTILELIPIQLECERSTAFLRDQRSGKLHARQVSGSSSIEIVLERGVGIAGYVSESGESVLLNDVQNDPRFDPATDRKTGFSTRQMLCVPLRTADGELIGSLQAINARSGAFSNVDLAYIQSFASIAAIAVEREVLANEAMRSHLLSTELELARGIQQRLLPHPGKMDLLQPFSAWGTSQACYDVGGDAYDAIVLPSGDLAFWVADVSGKGIGAALLMTSLQTELRALVRGANDLAQVASELNSRVNDVAPLGTYATLFLGLLSGQNERMSYVNAGHLPPQWIDAAKLGDRTFPPGGMPIGLMSGTSYEAGETVFSKGERLAIFSDGVTDAENTAGATYEIEGLASALAGSLARMSETEVEAVGAAVFADLDRFRIGAPAKDDTTLLIVGLN